METLAYIFVFMMVWAVSSGKALATTKNYGMGPHWYVFSWMGGPFTAMVLWALVRNSDEMEIKRKLTYMKTEKKLIEAKLKEEKRYNRYLECE